MKSVVVVFLVGILIGGLACYGYFQFRNQPSKRERAYNYLESSYNSTLGLCYEHPDSNFYWVGHDNILASYVLQQWNTTISDNITATIRRISNEYNLSVSESGFPLDNKLEALLGYDVYFFFKGTETIALNNSYYGSILMTEGTNINTNLGFTNYTDLLCYASLVEWRRQNDSGADYYFEMAKASWDRDGKGFRDVVFYDNHTYATYKLGLFYCTSRILNRDFDFKKELIDRVWFCQNDNGGFMTDYYGNDTFPSWTATNTETTSIILLADILPYA
jgi:hypothetical protein